MSERTDTERLNWLAGSQRNIIDGVQMHNDGDGYVVTVTRNGFPHRVVCRATLREAIDAAIDAALNPPGAGGVGGAGAGNR